MYHGVHEFFDYRNNADWVYSKGAAIERRFQHKHHIKKSQIDKDIANTKKEKAY
jgi:hypothetical protein